MTLYDEMVLSILHGVGFALGICAVLALVILIGDLIGPGKGA